MPEIPDTLPSPRELAAMLVRGDPVPDALFDSLYPAELRYVSDICWTPVEVIREIVRLIAPTDQTRVLDVGSGPGKFCLVASLLGPGRYTGIELKPELDEVARATQVNLDAQRASFSLGDAFTVDWGAYDVLYLYNPFQEFLARTRAIRAGWSVTTTDDWLRYARAAYQNFGEARVGTRVVLFYGFGLDMPPSYERVAGGRDGLGPLEVWQKRES